MTITTTISGQRVMLGAIVGGIEMSLRLFSNDHRPTNKDVFLTFDEPKGKSYNPLRVEGWSVSKKGAVVAKTKELSFKFPSPIGKVFGYFVTTLGKVPEVLFSERFSNGVIDIRNSGDELRISLTTSLAKG